MTSLDLDQNIENTKWEDARSCMKIFDFVEWVPDETDVPNYFHRKKIPFEMDLEEINTFLQSLFWTKMRGKLEIFLLVEIYML